MMARERRTSSPDGIPIEQAPLWVLVIAAFLFWLVIFPAAVGLLDAFDLYRGRWLATSAVAAVIAAALIVGLATRKPWRRAAERSAEDERPHLVRFSTWLMTTIFVPNVLQGVLVLSRKGAHQDYLTSLAIAAILSAVHGAYALADRWKSRFR